jgi:hypothetical protein
MITQNGKNAPAEEPRAGSFRYRDLVQVKLRVGYTSGDIFFGVHTCGADFAVLSPKLRRRYLQHLIFLRGFDACEYTINHHAGFAQIVSRIEHCL